MCLLKKWYKINVCSGMSNNECVATDIKLKGKHNAPTNEKPVEGCGAWVGDLIIFVGPGLGHVNDLVLLVEESDMVHTALDKQNSRTSHGRLHFARTVIL